MTPAADQRVTTTPNGVMTTYASPSQGSRTLSVWRTEMVPGASGPLHVVDSEQVVVVLEGAAQVLVSGETHRLAAGDAVVLPAHAERRVSTDAGLVALLCGSGAAIVRVPGEPGDRGTPAWIA